MGAVLSFVRELTFKTVGPCANCGVEMALLADLEAHRRRDHETFFCPNGHPQHFPGKSDVEKLREELATEKARRERAEQRARDEADHAKKQVAAARGQVTRIKNRVGNGVCPCCNRTFQNLLRHMETKHPGYAHGDEHAGDGDGAKV